MHCECLRQGITRVSNEQTRGELSPRVLWREGVELEVISNDRGGREQASTDIRGAGGVCLVRGVSEMGTSARAGERSKVTTVFALTGRRMLWHEGGKLGRSPLVDESVVMIHIRSRNNRAAGGKEHHASERGRGGPTGGKKKEVKNPRVSRLTRVTESLCCGKLPRRWQNSRRGNINVRAEETETGGCPCGAPREEEQGSDR
ncbi:hypothetical protein Tco_0105206 [Tanacetum coccineum]